MKVIKQKFGYITILIHIFIFLILSASLIINIIHSIGFHSNKADSRITTSTLSIGISSGFKTCWLHSVSKTSRRILHKTRDWRSLVVLLNLLRKHGWSWFGKSNMPYRDIKILYQFFSYFFTFADEVSWWKYQMSVVKSEKGQKAFFFVMWTWGAELPTRWKLSFNQEKEPRR